MKVASGGLTVDLPPGWEVRLRAQPPSGADRSRNLGNVIHYCRWRQIQRLIEMLAVEAGEATVH